MIRRTIHWKVLFASFIAAGGLGIGLYLLHAWQLSRLSKSLLIVSQARETQQQWLEAASYLDRYLRVHPTDVSVRSRLAAVYARHAEKAPEEKPRAVELHYRALAARPTAEEEGSLRAKLARLLVETGRFSEAEREARRALEKYPAEKHPAQSEACRALALALFAQWERGALTSAKLGELNLLATAERARRLNPADELLAEVTAAFYRDHSSVVEAELPELSDAERDQRADACLDDLVQGNPQSAQAYLARFRYRSRYELPGGADDIAKALELAPEDVEVLHTSAVAALHEAALTKEKGDDAALAADRFVKSQQLFEKAVASKSSAIMPESFLGLGDALLGQEKQDEALAAWRSGLKRFHQPTVQITLHGRVADALLRVASSGADRSADAKDTLDAIEKLIGSLGASVPRDERLALLQAQDLRRASWHMQQEDAGAAIPLLQDVVARQTSGAAGNASAAIAWTLLGRANAQLGQWNEAAVAFDRAAPLDPKSSTIRLAGAYAWLQVGRPELAVDRAEQAFVGKPSIDAALLLATAELDRQVRLPVQQRTWDRLERSLAALEKDPAKDKVAAPWRIDFLRADCAALRARQEGDEIRGRNEAVAVIERAESTHGQSAEFWQLAALAYQRLSHDVGADRAQARFAEVNPSKADQAVLKSRLAMLRKDADLAQKTLETAAGQAASGERSKLRRELIEVVLAKRDLVLADRLLSAEAEQRPGDVQLSRMACELALERNDRPAVTRWQQRLTAAGPLGVWWSRYFGAVVMVSSATGPDDEVLKDALEEQAKLAALRPHWPTPYTLRGMIELRLGRLEEAAESLEQAVQLGERKLLVFEQLISLLDRLNRPADAEKYLSRLESYMPFSQRLTEVATNHELRRDNPEQAIEIARNATERRPNDAFAHLWLARLLLVNKQYDVAEPEFQRALALAPTDVRTWNGLFTFYVRTGATEKARQTLDDLRAKADLSAADRSFVVAQGYELLGEWDNATKQYEAAATDAPERAIIHIRLATVHLRSDPRKAEASLRKALAVEPDSPVGRRMLAALLASRGGDTELREAENLLSQTGENTATVAVEDRRLNALLLAQYGDASQTTRAAQILEEVVGSAVGGLPGDRLVLAQIYENQARSTPDETAASAKRDTARQHLVAVATGADAKPGQLAALVEFFLRNNQPAEAAAWLDKLENLLSARAKDEPVSLAQLIDLRIRQGSSDRCGAWLARLAACDSEPLRPVALEARYLAAQNRAAEIAPLVEAKTTEAISAAQNDRQRGQLARIAGDIFRTIKQLPQAERWYQAAVGHDPAQFPALAMALASDGKVAEVIRLCRDHSERDGTSLPAIVLASALAESAPSGDHDREVDEFLAQALARHPRDSQLLYTLATFRAVQGRYNDAAAHYREVLKKEPKSVPALNNLAMILAEIPDQRGEALALIDRAIAIAGQQPGLLDTKGAILVYQGQPQKAVQLLEAAAREAGNDSRHRFHLAAAYHGLGQTAKAKEQLAAAIGQQLEKQVLTTTDRRLLADLKASLIP